MPPLAILPCASKRPSNHTANYAIQARIIKERKLFTPSQRPSFEHARLTCYTLLICYHLPSLFHCFTLSSKPTFSENLILHLSLFLSVGLISWL